MLENIINKTKLGVVAVGMALSLYGCETMQVESPVTQYPSRPMMSQCDDDFNNRNLYCDRNFIYPIVQLRFK